MQGWECPKCGRVYSRCTVCPVGTLTMSTTTLTCTCFTTARCPLHGTERRTTWGDGNLSKVVLVS